MDNENTELYQELQPGTALNGGKYIIEKKIGEGGFGITYKAMQTGLNRAVCIKEYFLAGRCVRNTQAHTVQLQSISEEAFEKYRQAFVKEAQTLATLHHPNIVEVIDIFDENNTSYMVMPFIEGQSLQSIVEKNGPLSYPDAVNYLMQIANAVEYIHERNILHRDIKPDNIMITADYKAILIDFGSAREFQQDKIQRQTSMLTHGYAPPEQYTANSKKGAYTDVYALGASFYFILTGQVPVEAAARLIEDFPEPKSLRPDLPDEVNRTIMKAMQLKTSDRYQTVQEFKNDLCCSNQQIETEKSKPLPSNVEPKPKRSGRTKWIIGGMILIILLMSGAIALNMLSHQQKAKEKELKQEQRLHKLDSIYTQAMGKFEIHLKKINSPNDLTNPTHVIESLEAMKTIEDMESQPLFNEIGKDACLKEKIRLYEQKLNEEKDAISKELSELEKERMTDCDNYESLQKKKLLIDTILVQMNSGSVAQIKFKTSKRDLNG